MSESSTSPETLRTSGDCAPPNLAALPQPARQHGSIRGRLADITFYVLYLFFYSGWWFHVSVQPSVGNYSTQYLLFLLLLGCPLFLPTAVRWYLRNLPQASRLLASAVLCLSMGFVYCTASLMYYSSREYRFDPYLQIPAPSMSEHPREKQPGTVRIVTLGGSTTQNLDLDPAERYPEQLQSVLRASYPDVPIEVLNGGMSWYTTRHSLIQYVSQIRDWQPNIVVILHGCNDLFCSFSSPPFAIGEYNDLYTHFYGAAWRAARAPTFEETMIWGRIESHWFSSLRFQAVSHPLERYEALRPFERNLRTLIQYLRADGVSVVLVTQATLIKPNPSPDEQCKLLFGRELCLERATFWNQTYPSFNSMDLAMRAFQQKTREIATDSNSTLADVAAEMAQTLQFFHDDVHYTPRGARFVAETVAQSIRRDNLVERHRDVALQSIEGVASEQPVAARP